MTYKKEQLIRLLKLVEEISSQTGNEWFKDELSNKVITNSTVCNTSAIEEIYEHCIKLIIKDHADKFYKDFKLNDIKDKLISDFIRMEKFRREDNFEDFCLALFQQIEGIVNELITLEIELYIKAQKNIETHKAKDKTTGSYEPQHLWQLIFFPSLLPVDLEKKLSKSIFEWDFSERYKAVLFVYYFKKKINNYQEFQSIFFIGNDLYQARNLNHRGGRVTTNQQKIIEKVKTNSHKYYFKFLGFLEDITSKINSNI